MNHQFLVLALVAGVTVISGCGKSETENNQTDRVTTATTNLTKAFPSVVPLTSETFHQVGTFKPDVKTWSASVGEIGVLIYGPYWALSPGKYRVSFKLTTVSKGAEVLGAVDVNAFTKEKPNNTVASKSINPSPGEQIIPLEFDVPSVGPLFEFRVTSSGRGQISVSEIKFEVIR